MAGAGFKTFATGEVLTAANVNTYLMDQTVLVFADAAARTTALGANVAEGMISYLKDTDSVQKYNGSAWVGISPLTTKGDVFTYSTTDARLAVGANDTVLTADSTAPTGLKWAAASGGINAVYLSKYSTNNNYISNVYSSFSGVTATLNQTYYMPILLSATTLDRISIATWNSGYSGTGAVRLGIYNNNSTTNTPSTVLLDAGQVSTTAVNTRYEITINQTVSSGLYWLAFNMQTSPTTPTYTFCNNAITSSPVGKTSDSVNGALTASLLYVTGYTESSITGAFATAGTLTRNTTTYPAMAVRY